MKMKKCKYCNGTGVVKKDNSKHGAWWNSRKKPNNGKSCRHCHGKGVVQR